MQQHDVPAAVTRTITLTETEPGLEESPPNLTLQLGRRRVRWSEDTHDNENDGKRSSKSCCIYHKPRRFDESSTESSGDDSSDDDSDHGSLCSHGHDSDGVMGSAAEHHEHVHRSDHIHEEHESSNPAAPPRLHPRSKPHKHLDADDGSSSSSDGGPVRPRRHHGGRRPRDSSSS